VPQERQELRRQVPRKLGLQALQAQGLLVMVLQVRPQPELQVQPALGFLQQALPRQAQRPLAG
jgi:hypothetical protein